MINKTSVDLDLATRYNALMKTETPDQKIARLRALRLEKESREQEAKNRALAVLIAEGERIRDQLFEHVRTELNNGTDPVRLVNSSVSAMNALTRVEKLRRRIKNL